MASGPGKQHAEIERVQERLLADPFALVDEHAMHERDLAGRAAEGQNADPAPRRRALRLKVGGSSRRSCVTRAVRPVIGSPLRFAGELPGVARIAANAGGASREMPHELRAQCDLGRSWQRENRASRVQFVVEVRRLHATQERGMQGSHGFGAIDPGGGVSRRRCHCRAARPHSSHGRRARLSRRRRHHRPLYSRAALSARQMSRASCISASSASSCCCS